MDDNLKHRLRVFFQDIDTLPETIKRINQEHQHSAADLVPMLQAHLKSRCASVFGIDVSDVEGRPKEET